MTKTEQANILDFPARLISGAGKTL